MLPVKTQSVHFASATNDQSEGKIWPGNTFFFKSVHPTLPYPLFEHILLLCFYYVRRHGCTIIQTSSWHSSNSWTFNALCHICCCCGLCFKRTEMPNVPSAAIVYPAADYNFPYCWLALQYIEESSSFIDWQFDCLFICLMFKKCLSKCHDKLAAKHIVLFCLAFIRTQSLL